MERSMERWRDRWKSAENEEEEEEEEDTGKFFLCVFRVSDFRGGKRKKKNKSKTINE
jgi:hypothetical protein